MKKKLTVLSLAALLVLFATACGQSVQEEKTPDQSGNRVDLVSELGLTTETKDASSYTAQINSALFSLLD